MIGLAGVARSGADSLILLVNELALGELPRPLDAPGDAGTVVEELGKGLGQAVGQGLHHERFVEMVFRP